VQEKKSSRNRPDRSSETKRTSGSKKRDRKSKTSRSIKPRVSAKPIKSEPIELEPYNAESKNDFKKELIQRLSNAVGDVEREMVEASPDRIVESSPDKIIQSQRRVHRRNSHRKIPSGTTKNMKKLWEDFAQDEGHDTDYRKWTKVDESYLKTDESLKRDDVSGAGDDGTIEWSKSTHARSDSTPKVVQIYHHWKDQSNRNSDQINYQKDRRRKTQKYQRRKSPRVEPWRGIQSRRIKNHNSPRKNVHWLVDKFSRSCYIKFWNKLEDFGVSFLITLSLSKKNSLKLVRLLCLLIIVSIIIRNSNQSMFHCMCFTPTLITIAILSTSILIITEK